MPTRTGQDSKGCYARWGRHGKKYYYACGDTSARKRAVSKADRQGRAVRASGWTGNAALTAKRRRGKLDPSRTYALRKRFAAEMRRRTNALVREVYAQVVTRDAYGLIEKEKQAARLALHAGYAFATDAQKVTAFRQWLQQQVDDKVLSVQGGKAGEPWTSQYVQSAYKQGAYRSYASKYKTEAERRAPGLGVTRGEFIKEAFFSPEMMSKVELLSTRAYESLKGITAAMASEMNRVFATALVEGRGAAKTARMLRDAVGNLTSRRALVLARTEVIYAHAEGQLDGYAQLGVDTVTAEVEWSTANDGAVCEECGSMEGQTYRVSEAHGLIPLHPNCRCAWVPASESKSVVKPGLESRGSDITYWNKRDATTERNALAKALEQATGSERDAIALKISEMDDIIATISRGLRPIREVTAPISKAVKTVRTTKPVKASIKSVKPGVAPTPSQALRVTYSDPTKGTAYETAEECRQAVLKTATTQGTDTATKIAELKIQRDEVRSKLDDLFRKTGMYATEEDKANLAANTLLQAQLEKELSKIDKVYAKLVIGDTPAVDIQAARQALVAKTNLSDAVADISAPADAKEAIREVMSWIPKERVSDVQLADIVNLTVKAGKREVGSGVYYANERTMYLSVSNPSTAAHEFTHHLTHQLRSMDTMQRKFFEARTKGEAIVKFGQFEGKRDNFATYNEYAGRLYMKRNPEEIMSVAIETIFKNPAKAAADDPEWFDMVISALKGIPTG